jgi:hypothetical protein
VDERAFDERYRHWAQRSGELFTEASRYIPGGAGSSARTVKFGWKPYPPFMAEGPRSRLRNVDGHEYVDYLLGLGPMILGHRHPAVTRAVTRARPRAGYLLRLALRVWPPRDDDTDHSAWGAALIAALAVEGSWSAGAFPAAGLATEPDQTRATGWDELWAADESARLRLHPRVR